jgi:hypothetical protein
MRKIVLSYCLLIFIWGSMCGNCYAVKSNKVYFNINPNDRKIVLPVILNNNDTANLAFDSGAGIGTFILDSTFCATHPNVMSNLVPDTIVRGGSSWSSSSISTSVYKITPKVNISNVDMNYSYMMTYNWKKYFGNYEVDGMFNIPKNDTTHVWELNFDHNYLEIHSDTEFKMPRDCFVTSLIIDNKSPYPFNIQLPLKIKCDNGDTLTINRNFMIDTGMPWDIALLSKAEELPFFNKRQDAEWTEQQGTYFRQYNVTANIFEQFKIDSLRIYTFDFPMGISANYLIGQNFLKRFNVFFDLKNRQLGLQPIKSFQRIIDTLYRRFHYSTKRNSNGKFLVTMVAGYKENYYKTAGLQKGDEIVTVDSKPYKDITREERRDFCRKETLVFDIIRKGKPMKIVVKVDKNEKQGD